MKIKVDILKQEVIVQTVIFDDMDYKEFWLQQLAVSGAWGLLERPGKNDAGEDIILPAEYSVIETDVTNHEEQKKINMETRAYLASTDWMVIRQMERGIEIPDDVKQARIDAVNRIQ